MRQVIFVIGACLAIFFTPAAGSAQPMVTVDTQRSPQAGEFIVPVNKSQVLRIDQRYASLLVGNPDIADVLPLSDRTIYVLGKKLGSTSLTIYGPSKQLLAVVDLVISYDTEGLKAKLFEVLPNERIEVRTAQNSIVLGGPVSSSDALSKVLAVAENYAPGQVTNLLTVRGSQQVMLQVQFSEMDRNTAKEIGIDPNTTLGFTSGSFNFTALSAGAVLGSSAPFGTLGFLADPGGGVSLASIFHFLEDKGLIKTLAEPNLVALSGDTANFLAGGEFPIPVVQSGAGGGAPTITVEFKEFGVGLSFTPTILGDGLINLAVNPEVSAIDTTTAPINIAGFQVPGLTTRRASTTLEMRDGQSFAIAGLLQSNYQDTIKQFPWLGDIPVLGLLFRSTRFQKNETELVIIVTPHLVKPGVAESMKAPTDTFIPPSEQDLFLFGHLEDPASGQARAGGTQVLGDHANGGMSGSYGHIIQ